MLLKKAGVALALLAVVGSVWLFRVGEEVYVTIKPGQSAGETAKLLKEQGVIGSPTVFRVLAKVTGLHTRLKPGAYRMRKLMSSPEAIWRLWSGKVALVRIVIPEGFSARQIAERFEAAGITKAAAFEEYARANRLEGYLFPTTYFFGFGMDAATVAHLMHQEFRKAVEPEYQGASQPHLSFDQMLTLASIVQREAALPAEQPMIAAVYLNRLDKRMRLEADPTVQYAVANAKHAWKKRLTRSDLAISSPYNTYLNFGLPPGPICSAGVDSVRAVLKPAQTTALYFVANLTGGHTFSTTYEDHLKAVAEARSELRRRGLR